MRNITYFINEALDSKFSKATVAAIEKNILGAKFHFDIKGWTFKKFKVFKDGKYIKHSYEAYKGSSKEITEKGDLIFIRTDGIGLGYSGNSINLKVKGGYRDNCELVNAKYDKKKDITTLTFELDGMRYNSGFEWLRGKVTVEIPTDIMNAKENYSDFDCKGYDKFMEKFLPQKAEYLRQIDLDDLITWSSMIQDNVLVISVELQTGKGYGDNHLHTNKYEFKFEDYSYRTNKMLADKDHEAQIVRKFISGIQEFTKSAKSLPEKVTVNIIQELD